MFLLISLTLPAGFLLLRALLLSLVSTPPPYSDGGASTAQYTVAYVSAGATAATRQRVIAHTLDTRLSHTRK